MPEIAQEPDYKTIADLLKAGYVVPFFGAGASIGCGFPSGTDLAQQLVKAGEFPDEDGQGNLAFVASYLVQVSKGSATLNYLLRTLFRRDANPSELHQCVASIDGVKLVVTTNYDDLIERALEQRKPRLVVDRGTPGAVYLREAGKPWVEVRANVLTEMIQDWNQPVVFKMHGSHDADEDNDAFLITEEQYVDFLGRPETGQIPPVLVKKMKKKAFLFLGYGLKDWNVRVMLRKLMLSRNPADRYPCWAIVRSASAAEKALWRSQGVDIFELDLNAFTEKLREKL